MQAIKMLFLMVIFVLVVGFITQNQWMLESDHFVQFTLSSYRPIPTPIPLIMALCVLLGAITIFFTMFLTQLRLKRKVREQTRTIQLLEKEINELRNLPITEIEEDIDESAAAIEEDIE
jgi:uncharacterized membrane protein YciS (DUF1049 family)